MHFMAKAFRDQGVGLDVVAPLLRNRLLFRKALNRMRSMAMPGTFLPFMYEGKVYGLPETQDFYLTFYRKDVLGMLNITVPSTWEGSTSLRAACWLRVPGVWPDARQAAA